MLLKVLPGNEVVLLIPAVELDGVPHLIGPNGTVPFNTPTTEVINHWLQITKPSDANASAGGNISCAIVDDMSLGLTDSDTDDSRSICSKGQAEEMTFYNFDAELNLFRDEDLAGDGVFNLARDLTYGPDVPYIIAQRIGEDQKTLATVGERWNFFYAWTDNPVPGYGDGEMQTIGATMVPKNVVNKSYELEA